ncbi:MAG: hypothetical protein PHT54_03310 [Candidatus Nanoarchaeia archaeon]|nr:hypothetical protein [Candidatus Nanoarchaeia archaeon]
MRKGYIRNEEGGNGRLIINQDYLKGCNTLEKAYNKLEKSLMNSEIREIQFVSPKDMNLASFIPDLVNFLVAKSIDLVRSTGKGYTIKLDDKIDPQRVYGTAGNNAQGNPNIKGDSKTGYEVSFS